MITKEHKFKKYCCFYASEFHLEMILLPYIKENLNKTKFLILTEENLTDSINLLLDRTNLDIDKKEQILKLNWNNKDLDDIANHDFKNNTIIINGNNDFIINMNKKITDINTESINIIDCYNINDRNISNIKIQKEYDGILNTKGT